MGTAFGTTSATPGGTSPALVSTTRGCAPAARTPAIAVILGLFGLPGSLEGIVSGLLRTLSATPSGFSGPGLTCSGPGLVSSG